MRKNLKIYFGLLVSSLIISICVNSSAVAVSRDCSIYESIYKGITCRNASLEDTPICDDSEDILNSPRAPKLCCCERLLESEKNNTDNLGGTGTKEKFKNCKDFNCQPGTEGERSINCPKDFISTSAHKDEDDPGTTCCCPINKTTYTDFFCRVIGCADTLPTFATNFTFGGPPPPGSSGAPSSIVFSPPGPTQQLPLSCANNLTTTTIEITTTSGTLPFFGSTVVGTSPTDMSAPGPPIGNNTREYACCCPGEPKLENTTCKFAIGCKNKSQLGQCSTGQQLVDNIIVRKKGSEATSQALSCCCP